MQHKFDQNLHRMVSTKKKPSILLAVSGGIDSICMANLFKYSLLDIEISIAHVNFSLRAEQSDADEQLVQKYAKDWGIKYFVKRFETTNYAKKNSISTQMAARDLRYNWFADLISEYSFDYLSIGHNADDSVETLFLNLIRGTGIRGLAGIREINNYIIRPIMIFTREQISNYIYINKVAYRDDISNFESNYPRNRIRNKVFPELKKINSSFIKTISRDIIYFNQASEILDKLYLDKRPILIDEYRGENGIFASINISNLVKEESYSYWLYRILGEFGFNNSQIPKIALALDSQPGKEFYSPTYYLLRDRTDLKLYPLSFVSNIDESDILVDKLPFSYTTEFGQFIEVITTDRLSEFVDDGIRSYSKNIHIISTEKLNFPLKSRLWQSGDRFKPLGMNNFKKISDYLVDAKVNRLEKRCQRVLVNMIDGFEEVCVLLGHRIDQRYR